MAYPTVESELGFDHAFLFLITGVILKVKNDGSLMPKLNHSMCISLIEDIDESKSEGQSFVFILPRGDDKLWLGGMVQPNQWDRNLTLDYPPIRRMFEKVKEFYPPLRNYGDEDVEEVLVLLRPARNGWSGIQCVFVFCTTMDMEARV